MSHDISIDFEGKSSSFDELTRFVEAFFNGAAEFESRETNNCHWIIIKLSGRPSHFQYEIAKYPLSELGYPADRWIEFWFYGDSAGITTRMQDDYTNTLAEGLANFIRRAIYFVK